MSACGVPSFARVAAEHVWRHLAIADAPPARADVIIGFGHFDPAIPRRCAELWRTGVAPLVLFTGGIGAGTADLGRAEALYFADEARRCVPDLPDAALVLEARSTNTSENLALSATLLAARRPPLRFGRELRSAVLVATPYRQRRVWLTCRKHLPGVDLCNVPPTRTYDEDEALFASKNQRLEAWLGPELDRLPVYAERGWIAADEPLPPELVAAREVLRQAVA